MMRLILPTLLALAGCTANVGGAAMNQPGEISCSGKTVVSIVGTVGPSAGLNGAVTADCGPGSYIRWGPLGSFVAP